MAPVYIAVGFSAAIWLYIIYRNDRFEPEPVRWLLFVGIAGGLLSGLPAALLNSFAAIGLGLRMEMLTGESPVEISTRPFFPFCRVQRRVFQSNGCGFFIEKVEGVQ